MTILIIDGEDKIGLSEFALLTAKIINRELELKKVKQ